jgi:hypothetical protein
MKLVVLRLARSKEGAVVRVQKRCERAKKGLNAGSELHCVFSLLQCGVCFEKIDRFHVVIQKSSRTIQEVAGRPHVP